MKLRKSCFGMDYEMETIIQALVIQINMVWNQFHEIIHELIRYAHALWLTPGAATGDLKPPLWGPSAIGAGQVRGLMHRAVLVSY